MKIKSLFALLVIGASLTATAADPAESRYGYLYKDLPFEMPVIDRPRFPERELSIKSLGAIGDGSALNTEVFKTAIDSMASLGGGRVVVPAGIWLTGPIELKSNIDLHLEEGAVIAFSPRPELYDLVKTSFEGLDMVRTKSPISGQGLVNVAITGKGAINGNGDAWRPLKKGKVHENFWKNKIANGGFIVKENTWYPSEGAFKGKPADKTIEELTPEELNGLKQHLRPVMVSLVQCKNVMLEGVLFENSPAWNIHPLMCENLIIDDIFVRNPSFAQNGDGIDVESCTNVILANTTLDVGDDAICIKSGKDEDGRRRGIPCTNVIVDNCRVFQGHGGFVVGSEMSGGVKNIYVGNCRFLGTDVGLRFKSQRGRGGVVENIFINGINMYNITNESLLFDLYYFTKKTDTVPAVDETTPQFKDIFISNVISCNSGQSMFFNGLPEMNIANIHVTDSYFSSRRPAKLVESDGITIENVTLVTPAQPSLILDKVKNVSIKDLTVGTAAGNPIRLEGSNKNITLPRDVKQTRTEGY